MAGRIHVIRTTALSLLMLVVSACTNSPYWEARRYGCDYMSVGSRPWDCVLEGRRQDEINRSNLARKRWEDEQWEKEHRWWTGRRSR